MNLTDLVKHKSLTFLSLPFLINFFIHEQSFGILFSFLLVFLLVDIFVMRKLKNKILGLTIFFFVSVFLYSFILYYDTYLVVHELRFRAFFAILSLFFLIIFGAVVYNNLFQFINVFLLFFSLSFLFVNSAEKYDRSLLLNNLNFKFLQKNWAQGNKSSEPLVFIILDELASGSESFLFSKDSLDLSVSKSFKSLGFEVIDDFPSVSLSTKFSLPSIFNFNLHGFDNELARIDSVENDVRTVSSYDFLYRNNLLLDSLTSKGVSVINYGMAPMQKANNQNEIYPWFPRKTTNRTLKIIEGPSSLNRLLNYTIVKNIHLKYNFNPVDVWLDHNEEVWSSLSLDSFKKNHFYYYHIIAPHYPYYERQTITERQKSLNAQGIYAAEDTASYITFRRFVLKKLFSLLKEQNLEGVRVIISSDHGFRQDPKNINPNLTMLFLRGFNKGVRVESVQSLGYLINASF